MTKEMKKILLNMLLMVLIFIVGILGLDAINSRLERNIEPYKETEELRLQNENQQSDTGPSLNP